MIRASGKALRRVVITGLGVCCPLGVGTQTVWKRLLEGRSGITNTPESFKGVPSQVAGLVPRGNGPDCFNEEDWVSSEERKTMDMTSVFALCAAGQALEDAKWRPKSAKERQNTGISVGIIPMPMIDAVEAHDAWSKGSYKDIDPLSPTRMLANMPATILSIRYNLLGPNRTDVGACAAGLNSIGVSSALIAHGACDVMVAGGTIASRFPLVNSLYCRVRALSMKFNSEPQRASRPFDSARDGFVTGEGSGFVVLEELEHAQQRGAPIYCEVLGHGMSSDGFHLRRPHEDGDGAYHCMQMALKDAGISPDSVQHINAHATSTVLGDRAENKAIKKLFGEHAYKLFISATKSMTGHLAGGAGGVETVFTALAVRDGIAPPTINLENPDPDFDLNYVPNRSMRWTGNGGRRIALKNSFGLGGTNGTLCLGEL